jgi:hypothetical protein
MPGFMGLQSIASGLHGTVESCRVARSRGSSDYTREVKWTPIEADRADFARSGLVDEGATDAVAKIGAQGPDWP